MPSLPDETLTQQPLQPKALSCDLRGLTVDNTRREEIRDAKHTDFANTIETRLTRQISSLEERSDLTNTPNKERTLHSITSDKDHEL
mgnify:CR=1 FL=1